MNAFELIITTAVLYGLVVISEIIAAKTHIPLWAILPFGIAIVVQIQWIITRKITKNLLQKIRGMKQEHNKDHH